MKARYFRCMSIALCLLLWLSDGRSSRAQDTRTQKQASKPASTVRNSSSRFVWPSWLPEYPGWYDAKYLTGTEYEKRGVLLLSRDVDSKQGEDQGGFDFIAPDIIEGAKPVTGEGWHQLDMEVRASVAAFYRDKCKELGMAVELENNEPPEGVLATDARRSLIVRAVGGASWKSRGKPGGVIVRVLYAPCAGIDKGEVVVSHQVSKSHPAMDAAKLPCSVVK